MVETVVLYGLLPLSSGRKEGKIMDGWEIIELWYKLSQNSRDKLGKNHLIWITQHYSDPAKFVRGKLRPGYSVVPEAYRELLDLLEKEV